MGRDCRTGGAGLHTSPNTQVFKLQAALKKYQTEQRGKGDALDKCQAELKKLRKKSQGSKNPQKYSDKELQVGTGGDPGGVAVGGSGWGSLPLSCAPEVPTPASSPGLAVSQPVFPALTPRCPALGSEAGLSLCPHSTPGREPSLGSAWSCGNRQCRGSPSLEQCLTGAAGRVGGVLEE